MGLIAEKDFVRVVDETTGRELEHPIPKHWVGTDLAPGVKPVRRSGGARSDQGGQQSDSRSPQVPAESENRDVLEKFAVESAGITEDEAKAFSNKAELHAAIVKATSGS